MPGHRDAAAAGQQAEPVVKAGRDLVRAHGAQPAAASSMASGMPSSARQILVTAGALAAVTSKPGRTARARWASSRTEA